MKFLIGIVCEHLSKRTFNIKKIKTSLFCVVLGLMIHPCVAQNVSFPYQQSFKSVLAPTGIVLPRPQIGTNAAAFTDNGLLLTNDVGNSFGAILLDGMKFEATNGIEIEFEYSMYGISTSHGDGLSFFLYDANATPMNIGNFGAGLGYVNLNGAYLGIGLDQYGNFKYLQRSGGSVQSGIVESTFNHAARISHITLRGSREMNYDVLMTRSTSNANGDNQMWDYNSKGFTSTNGIGSANVFSLRPLGLSRVVGDEMYRRTIISLIPHKNGGFLITVKIQHGNMLVPIISNYHYRTSITKNGFTYNTSPPREFKIGFAASTGEARQAHLISNLSISLPFFPEPKSDTMKFCKTYNGDINASIDPFANDLFYNGNLYEMPSAEGNNVDFNSFWFVDKNGRRLSAANRWTDEDKGTWEFNRENGQVRFRPVTGFTGTSIAYYTAKGSASKGGPFAQEIYRSKPVNITASAVIGKKATIVLSQ